MHEDKSFLKVAYHLPLDAPRKIILNMNSTNVRCFYFNSALKMKCLSDIILQNIYLCYELLSRSCLPRHQHTSSLLYIRPFVYAQKKPFTKRDQQRYHRPNPFDCIVYLFFNPGCFFCFLFLETETKERLVYLTYQPAIRV